VIVYIPKLYEFRQKLDERQNINLNRLRIIIAVTILLS
jgi:hypothetical protein